MFSVTGRVPSIERPVTVQWDNGLLSGDRMAVDMLRAFARAMEGQSVGPIEGPYTEHNHLANPLAIASLMGNLFDFDAVWSGDVPMRVAPPPPTTEWMIPDLRRKR